MSAELVWLAAHSYQPAAKKSYKPHKPDSVSTPSFIWPRHYCRDLAAYPGPRHAVKHGLERAALERSYTWHYSTQGLPVFRVTTEDRELLPHIFTFSTPKCGSYFLWHFLVPALLQKAGA